MGTALRGRLGASRLLILIGAAACGSPGKSDATLVFPASPLMTMTGKSVNVAFRSSPQPPTQGLTNFELTVSDMNDAPVDGLSISIQPWMPAMGHGAPVTPIVMAMGGGVYQVTNVDLFMQGEWELRTSISGPVTDSVDPEFEIQ